MKLGWTLATDIHHSGYGYVGAMLRDMVSREEDVHMLGMDEFGWDAMVSISPPRTALLGPHPRPDVIFHTMFEAEPLPPTWANILNRAGMLWVPSKYCADLFAAYGVQVPIAVSGYGYSPETFGPVPRHDRETPLKVIIWGDNLASRKNLMLAIRAYLLADIKGATLDVKITDSAMREGVTISDDNGVREDVRILTQPMRRYELGTWLQSADVLVYLSGGEGFGMIPFECMVTGMPVISTRNTGMLEYMVPGSTLVVPSIGRMAAPSLIKNFAMPDLTIEEPDVDAAVEHLRWVASNRNAAADIGMKGYEAVRDMTWKRAAEHAVSILRPFAASNSSLLEQTSMVY